jgi:hypothetical protein
MEHDFQMGELVQTKNSRGGELLVVQADDGPHASPVVLDPLVSATHHVADGP